MNTAIRTVRIIVIIAIFCMAAASALAQNDQGAQEKQPSVVDKVQWHKGPTTGKLGSLAETNVPQGYAFADGDDTRLLMEAMHNTISGKELGFLAPNTLEWFMVFEFDETGYVKDDDKNSLDADAMLETITKATDAANEERGKHGWAALHVTGWEQPPHYNPTTHNLEWAIKGQSTDGPFVNFNTRLLGRTGVMRVTLVVDPKLIQTTLPNYNMLLSGFSFGQGHKYAEYRQGDKLAEYGLAALVVGGGAAAAAKLGFFKYIWKALVIGFLAVVGFVKKLFGRKKKAAPETVKAEPDEIKVEPDQL